MHGAHVGRGDGRRIPRHEAHDEKDRTHIEEQHPRNHPVRRLGHRFGGLSRLRRSDGHYFGSEVKTRGRHGARQNWKYAVRRKAAVGREMGDTGSDSGHKPAT